jgi:hypothetical protein
MLPNQSAVEEDLGRGQTLFSARLNFDMLQRQVYVLFEGTPDILVWQELEPNGVEQETAEAD